MEIFYILFSNTGFKHIKNLNFFMLQGLVKFCLLTSVQTTGMPLKNFDFIAIIFVLDIPE
jgi:hypothetical protein